MSDGLVRSLWRYPVKSLLGEKLDSLSIDNRSVVNDRVYAISNAQGKFGRTIIIGDVELKVTHKTERCRMITLEQSALKSGELELSELENSPEILMSVFKEFNLNFGV